MSEELKYYKTAKQNNYGWNLTWEATNRFPIIAKRAFATLDDAQNFVDNDGTSCEGLILAVFNDPKDTNNGVYIVKKVKTSEMDTPGILLKAGSGTGSITSINFTAAKDLATSENIGQIIYILSDEVIYTYTESDEVKTFASSTAARFEKNDETGVITYYNDKDVVIFRSDFEGITDTVDYSAGPYIVTGEKALAKLGTTSASGDIAGDVENLKGSVSTLESDVDTLEGKVEALEGKIDVHPVKDIQTADGKSILVDGIATVDNVFDSESESNNPLTHAAIAGKIKEIEGTISLLPKFDIEVVSELPTENISETTIYLVVKEEGEQVDSNVYSEYIYVNSEWEKIGEQKIDLSNYYTKKEIEDTFAKIADLDDYVKAEEGKSLVSDEKIQLIDTNASDIAELNEVLNGVGTEGAEDYEPGLLKVVEELGENLSALEEIKITSVDGSDFIESAKDENNAYTVSAKVGTFKDDENLVEEANGLATVSNVSSFVQREIESAFAWVDVVEEE